ncbi:hypothetical protein ACFZAG_05670 [Streptomyces sp. NPDC012403]|uniref:hypothetical protein n=1 Tax=Streptomyces sp. NPDC012403 TaxID=3364831 RepID=UPI0036F0D15C
MANSPTAIPAGSVRATVMTPPENHGAIGGPVAVVLCVGSVALNFVGVMPLNATATDSLVAVGRRELPGRGAALHPDG